MRITTRQRTALTRIFSTSLALSLSANVLAQVRFSIDWNGSTVSALECTSGVTPITEGDILMPCAGVPSLGPLASPRIAISGGAGGLGLGLHGGCVGHIGGTPCGVEVDALSFGRDFPITQAGFAPGSLWWSADEYSAGIAGSPFAPNAPSEFVCGDLAADVMIKTNPMGPVPLPPLSAAPDHVGVIDGDGMASCTSAYPGLGLREPTFPTFAPFAGGDNLDAFDDQEFAGAPGGAFYSLDSAFMDPCSGVANSGSAASHGYVGGDILHTIGAGPTLWAPAAGLGLDVFGADTDDLDALAIFESGDGIFNPNPGPYGWGAGGTDMVLFSVRRGSAVIGMPDSFMGVPIEEGDILMPPIPGAIFPAIFVPAENLGLGTIRTGTVSGPCGFGDELDALDTHASVFNDCNGNGVEDAIDITTGFSLDTNFDGVPDECGLIANQYCFCPNGGVCFNPYIPGGCENSTSVGAILSASGTSSIVADDLVLTATQLPINQLGILFMGTVPIGPFNFGDGLRCVGGNTCRFPIQNSGLFGVISEGPGLILAATVAGCPIAAGDTWYFQGWYRDPGGPCVTGHNLSNATDVTFY